MAGASAETVALRELALALAPLARLDRPQRVTGFVRQLGWELPAPDLLRFDLAPAGELPAAVEAVRTAASSDATLMALGDLLRKVIAVAARIRALPGDVATALAAFGPFTAASHIREEIARRTLDFVIATYLATQHPGAHAVLGVLGIVECEELTADPSLGRSAHLRRTIRWERVPQLVSDPGALVRDVYGWGGPAFDAARFLGRLAELLHAFGVAGGLYPRTAASAAVLGAAAPGEQELRYPIVWSAGMPSGELGVTLARAAGSGGELGLGIMPYAVGAAASSVPVAAGWTLGFASTFDLQDGVGLLLFPTGLRVVTGSLPGAAPASHGLVRLTLVRDGGLDGGEVVWFGAPASTRLAARAISVAVGGAVDDGRGALEASLELAGAHLVIAASGDGLLGELLPARPIELPFDLRATWSSATGLTIAGGLGLTLHVPVGRTFLDVVRVDAIDLGVRIGAGAKVDLAVTTDVGVELGPFAAAIAGIGLGATVRIAGDGSGNLGMLDARVGFRPPSGIGLGLDAGVVVGAGFLGIEGATYRGALELTVGDTIAVAAVGIITTEMPDGRRGFSFKVLGNVRFEAAPIQIGFGFAIVGIGGLIAVHCRMNTEALREMVYAGTLRTLLFPADLGRDAPAILDRLDAAFPACRGSHVLGALVRITWGGGVPVLLADLGLFVELGGGFTIALAGAALLQLPTPSSPLVRLQLQILGILDLPRQSFSLDAHLFDSHIAGFPIEGDAALRWCWGNPSRFALSIGGFNPAYVAPPGFPALQRMAIVLSRDNPNIGFYSYLAITENSCQFGATVIFHWQKTIDLWVFGEHDVELSGSAGFDVLVLFEPRFAFSADFHAGFDLKVDHNSLMVVDLRLTLDYRMQDERPRDYHVYGSCKVKIWKVGATLIVDHWFGERMIEAPPPPLDGAALLVAELGKPDNWRVRNDRGFASGVAWRRNPADLTGQRPVLVDPLSRLLDFVELVMPLATAEPVTKIGHQRVAAAVFDVVPRRLDEQPLAEVEPKIERPFAPGDFFDLERPLEAPPSVCRRAGFTVAVGAVECPQDHLVECRRGYELHVLGDRAIAAAAPGPGPAPHVLAGASRRTGARRFTHQQLRPTQRTTRQESR